MEILGIAGRGNVNVYLENLKAETSTSQKNKEGHSGLILLPYSEFKQRINETAFRLSMLYYSLDLVIDVLEKSFLIPHRSPPDPVRNLGDDVIAAFRIR